MEDGKDFLVSQAPSQDHETHCWRAQRLSYHNENVYNKSKKFLYIIFSSYINTFFLFITELNFMVWIITTIIYLWSPL